MMVILKMRGLETIVLDGSQAVFKIINQEDKKLTIDFNNKELKTINQVACKCFQAYSIGPHSILTTASF